jgi:hypothetical protein
MFNFSHIQNTLLRLTIITCISVCMLAMASSDDDINDFAKRYAHAKSELEKRTVCIEAIDKGVVARGISIRNVKLLFGPDLTEKVGVDQDGASYGIVDFIRPKKAEAGKAVSDYVAGWYLVIYYDQSGLVLNYHLSNVHK